MWCPVRDISYFATAARSLASRAWGRSFWPSNKLAQKLAWKDSGIINRDSLRINIFAFKADDYSRLQASSPWSGARFLFDGAYHQWCTYDTDECRWYTCEQGRQSHRMLQAGRYTLVISILLGLTLVQGNSEVDGHSENRSQLIPETELIPLQDFLDHSQGPRCFPSHKHRRYIECSLSYAWEASKYASNNCRKMDWRE